MKIKFPTGTTAENNQLLLPEGMLSIDVEKKAVRLHDGTTQGGFELVGTRAVELPFKGEVAASDFITGDALAVEIGLTSGTSQHSDAGWLHFVDPVDGLTKYVAKRPFKHTISWNRIHAVNAVYGERTVVINGDTYRVRLLRGASTDPSRSESNGFDTPSTHGSEWNRLMYHITQGSSYDVFTSESNAPADWAQYTDADIVFSSGNGRHTWCQEVYGGDASRRIVRGGIGVSQFTYGDSSSMQAYFGWRPCLELVED